MNDRELMFLPAHEQRRMIADGEISSVELTEASTARGATRPAEGAAGE